MNIESLKKVREVILKTLMNTKMNDADKAELMINIVHFLNENNYEQNIKVLRKAMWKK